MLETSSPRGASGIAALRAETWLLPKAQAYWQSGFGQVVTNLNKLDSLAYTSKIGDALENLKDLATLDQNAYVETTGLQTEGAGTRAPWVGTHWPVPSQCVPPRWCPLP